MLLLSSDEVGEPAERGSHMDPYPFVWFADADAAAAAAAAAYGF